VLSVPGAPGFVSAGLLARLPNSMLGIGIVLLVQARTGSYAVAGAVAAAFSVVTALASPVVARLVDQYGQARVMLPAVGLHVAGLLLLVGCAVAGAPTVALLVTAGVAGAPIGSVGALVRARWSHALAGRDDQPARLHTAYSLESVLDEVVFVSGPPLVTLLAVGVAPAAGVLAAAAAVGVGGTLLFLQRRSEPPPTGARPVRGSGVMRSPGMVVLAAAFVFVGAIFGAMEVVVVAYTAELDRPAAAGWVLAVFALGSLLAGLVYGVVQWRSPAGRRFVVGVVLLAIGIAPTVLVEGVWPLAGVAFVAGFAISPMIISGTAFVQELVVPARLTEGLAWVATAIVLGVAAGSAVAGVAVESLGAHRAFAVPVASGAAAALVVLISLRWLRPVAPPTA
jgi:MFS family permease